MLLVVVSFLVFGIVSVTSSSIGIQIYNTNAEWKRKHPLNYNFLIANLSIALCIIVITLIYFIAGYDTQIVPLYRSLRHKLFSTPPPLFTNDDLFYNPPLFSEPPGSVWSLGDARPMEWQYSS